ncbi:glycosyltransferase [uncultured Mucilaginibacter sp.]|uniref:glycosyltransferase family 2 protein n=1 Tax=uncultured Mucilaginibacter sp. TaxID=797541 RepID=UPI00260C1263|nr:glycosyltransferase [uncultured Mucilaginibacter sp.]
METLVSIIVPNYNHCSFLKDRLESILNQTYTNFEIIILDDASTDCSNGLIRAYQTHVQVKHVVFNEKNSGSPFLQWKKGLELANGKYIWIAESDDIARLNFLETLIPILQSNPQLVLAYTDSEREESEWRKITKFTQQKIEVFEGETFVRQKMTSSPAIVNASAVVFKRETLQEEILSQANNYKTAYDWLLWCSIILKGKVAFYPLKLNFFRKHINSTSLTSTQQGLFVIEGLKVLSYLKNNFDINLTFLQKKGWASVWAQTSLLTNKTKNIFFKSYRHAWNISPILFFYFAYYWLKYKFFSAININLY